MSIYSEQGLITHYSIICRGEYHMILLNMRHSLKMVLFLVLLPVMFVTSCSGGKYLRTEPYTAESIDGLFDITFYYNQDYDGLKQVVILDVVDDDFEIVVNEPEYYVQTVKDVTGDDAVVNAIKFVQDHPNYINYKIIKIVGQGGDTIGYEVRPLYAPAMYGIGDVMDSSYTMEDDGTIRATISLKDQIKAIFEQDKDS